MNRLPLLVVLGVLAACAPTFRVRRPPSLTLNAPRAPAAPEAVAVAPPPPGTRATVTSAHPPPDLRAQTVAVVVDGDEALRALAIESLPRMLVASRYTRVLYPSLQAVRGSLERGTPGERVTFEATLPQLAMLQARLPAGHLLVIELRGDGGQTLEGGHAIPDAAMAQYRDGYERYRRELAAWRQRLRAEVEPYNQEVLAARQSYESRGGRYQSPDETELNERIQSWASDVAMLSANTDAAEQRAPSPEQVLEQAARLRGPREVRHRVRARALLTDLGAGETYWIDEIDATAETADAALAATVTRLLQDLGGGGERPATVVTASSVP